MNYPIIIIEIPHQRKAIAWTAYDEDKIINIALECHGMIYQTFDKKQALDCYGDWEEIPQEAQDILERDGLYVEYGFNETSEIHSKEEAESEIDVAFKAIGSDLSTMQTLTLDEARDFLAEKNNFHISHKYLEAMRAVRKEMEIHEQD